MPLFEYVGGIVRDLDGRLVAINGTTDHLHLLIRESKTVADMQFLKELKGSSSGWINENHSERFPENARFAWQRGYGWFSVSPSHVDAAATYIANQKTHHQRQSFQDEFRTFLEKYSVEFDERYVWD